MAYRVAVVGGLSLDCGGGDWVVEREWEPDSLCGLGSFPSPPPPRFSTAALSYVNLHLHMVMSGQAHRF
jgi:hypothetical protein